MPKIRTTPIDQKTKLLQQLKELENKISSFDKERAAKIGNLAKQYGLIDFSDEILSNEFKLIKEKYKHQPGSTTAPSPMDDAKKNS